MTPPSLLILTQPANCEQVDGQLLLRAVLQTQHLSENGTPVAHVLCDNPAAAEEFVDAYSKAYPSLEPQAPQLPRPEQLQSIVADGRLTPILGPNSAADDTKFDDAAAFHPLLVLSLGKPDALMRVLQIQQSVKDSVRVIEIAPPAETETPSMSVAEAVARHTIGATMESATATNFETRHGHDDTLSQSDDGTNTPLKLDSGELNLDHIESNTNGQQVHASVLAVTPGTTPVSSADHAAASPSVPHTDALMVGGGPDASQSSQSDPHGLTTAPTTAPTAVSAPEPIVAPAPEPTSLPEAANLVSDDNGPDALQPSNASGALPDDSNRKIGDPEPPETHESASAQTPPDAVQGANASAALPGTHESASTQTPPDAVQGANASAALADYPNRNASSSGSSEPRNSAPNDQPSVVVHLPHEPGENVTGSHPGSTDPNATTTNAEDLTHERVSFDHIGEDVVYPPTGTLTPEDDIPYPLPAAVGTDALVSSIHAGAADDIVDFEAIISIAHAHAAPEAFDPTLWRPPGADAQGGHDFCSSQPPHADVDHLDLPGPDQSSHEEHQITPAHHVDI